MSNWDTLYNQLQQAAIGARAANNHERERAFLDALILMDRLAA